MGLKGYRLWAMRQLDSTCRAPPPAAPPPGRGASMIAAEQGTPDCAHFFSSFFRARPFARSLAPNRVGVASSAVCEGGKGGAG
jgi:hypothetical protein